MSVSHDLAMGAVLVGGALPVTSHLDRDWAHLLFASEPNRIGLAR